MKSILFTVGCLMAIECCCALDGVKNDNGTFGGVRNEYGALITSGSEVKNGYGAFNREHNAYGSTGEKNDYGINKDAD